MRFTLLVAMLCLTSHAFSQKIRFTDKRNQWHTQGTQPDCGFFKHYYYSATDTVIHGKQYARRNCWTTYYGSTACGVYDASVTFIREDTVSGKVYFYSPWNNTESILYDYAVNAGDSIVYDSSASPRVDSIARVDTIVINGVNHVVQSLKPRNPENQRYIVVEGIGSLGNFAFEYEDVLQCFQQDTSIPAFVVHEPDCGCINDTFNNTTKCGKLLAVPQAQTEIGTGVMPNPANQKVTVSCLPGRMTSVVVTNCYGMKVLGTETREKEVVINCSEWANGVYFIMIADDQCRIVEKIIVQH